MRYRTVGFALLVGLAAAPGPAQEPAPSGVVPPRITAELGELPLPEAATQLARLTGRRISLPDPGRAASPALPDGETRQLDFERRARLSWRDAAPGTALRDFCRAFDCRLRWEYGEGPGLLVLPGPFPSGPAVRVRGYSIEINRLAFSEYRTAADNVPASTINQSLALEFAVRADSGDPQPVYELDNIRVVDQAGRDAITPSVDPGDFSPEGRCEPGPFPDERVQSAYLDWPYPAPQRLRVIEGDLLLYRRVRQSTASAPLPPRNPAPSPSGDVQVEVQRYTALPDGFRASVRLLVPADVHLQANDPLYPPQAVLADGSRVPVQIDRNAYWDSEDNGAHSFQCSLRASGLPSAPVRLDWPLVLKADPSVRAHFRWDNYPAEFGPRPAASPAKPRGAKP